MLKISTKISFILGSVLGKHDAESFEFIVDPRSLDSLSSEEIIVSEDVQPVSVPTVLAELSNIARSIVPNRCPLPTPQIVEELPFVGLYRATTFFGIHLLALSLFGTVKELAHIDWAVRNVLRSITFRYIVLPVTLILMKLVGIPSLAVPQAILRLALIFGTVEVQQGGVSHGPAFRPVPIPRNNACRERGNVDAFTVRTPVIKVSVMKTSVGISHYSFAVGPAIVGLTKVGYPVRQFNLFKICNTERKENVKFVVKIMPGR
jgi:hypothetical protein